VKIPSYDLRLAPQDQALATLLMSLLGVKRAWAVASHMSAYDPKRTWQAVQLPWLNIQVGPFQRAGLSRYDALS
jgi:hypothetical protein